MTRKVYVREVYFYIVCLIGIILFIVGLVTVFDNAISYIKPVTYNTREALLPGYSEQYKGLSDEEINTLIEKEMQNALEYERIFALRGLLRGGIFILISVPLFIYHWRKAQAMWKMDDE